jgi:hypothetical protein
VTKTPEHEALLKEATERFQQIQSDDKDNRDNYRADTLFVYSPGNQWPEEVRATRSAWKELCLEFNQLKQFAAQVVNDQRQNRPGIKIHPANGQASKEVAEIMQGLIRGIENDSRAEAVYDNGFQCGVVGGRGWWRVCSEYESKDGFTQKLVIKPIQDSLNVYADLAYQQPDGSDRSFVFVTDRFTKEEFKRKWPEAEDISWDSMESVWGSSEDIIVADYYRRICKTRTMVLMSDGAQGFKDEMPPPPEGVTIKREREVEEYSVEWYTLAGGQQVLATYEWPGTVIPVVCNPGEDMILDGKRVYQGLTRHARDAQSMLNFGMTQQAIHLSLTPRAPWVMAEGQNEGYENMWRDANTKNFNTLIYKPTTIGDQLAPPPQRTQPAMVSEGWDRWCQMMIGMIKSTIGMYEQSLGQKGNETSGRAITAREKQGDTATFNFVDNLSRAIALTGRILVECIPTYYDTERIVHIIGPDDTRKLVAINQAAPDPSNPLQAIKNNDVTVGQYAVTCEAGPSYATKRQETSEALMQLVQAFPPAAQVAGDLIIKSLDVADADVIAERMKLMLPPPIQQAEAAKAEGKTPPDPQVMAKMQEQQQHLDQAAQTMEVMHQQIVELKSGTQEKLAAAQLEYEYKTKMAEQDAAIAAEKYAMELRFKEEDARHSHELEIAKAQQSGEIAVEKAKIDAQAKIRAAMIQAGADLKIAKIQTGEEQIDDDLEMPEEEEDKEPKPPTQMEIMQQQLIEAVHSLAQSVAKPKKLVRGPDGRAIGVE